MNTRPTRPAVTNTKRPSNTSSRQKPATWQSKKLDDSWNAKDNWNTGNDAWSQSKDPIVETPKKISTPSSSTKTSNGGGAKTWASLLQ